MKVEAKQPLASLAGAGLVAAAMAFAIALNILWAAPLVHPRDFFSHDHYAEGLRAADALRESPSSWREQAPFHMPTAVMTWALGRTFHAMNWTPTFFYALYVMSTALLARSIFGRGRGWVAALFAALMPEAAALCRVYDTYTALLAFQALAILFLLRAGERGSILSLTFGLALLLAGAKLQLENTNSLLLVIGCVGPMAWAGIAGLRAAFNRTADIETIGLVPARSKATVSTLLLISALGCLVLVAIKTATNPYYVSEITGKSAEQASFVQGVMRFILYYPAVLTLNLSGPLTPLAAILGIVFMFKRKDRSKWPATVLLAAPFLGLTVITKKQENYAVILLPGLAVCAAGLMSHVGRYWRSTTIAAVSCASALWLVWGSSSRAENNLCGTAVGPAFDMTCWNMIVPAESYPDIERLEADVREIASVLDRWPSPVGSVYMMSEDPLLAKPAEFFLLRELPGYRINNMWTEGRFSRPMGTQDLIVAFETSLIGTSVGPMDYASHFKANPSVADTDEYWEGLFRSGRLEVICRGEQWLLLGHEQISGDR